MVIVTGSLTTCGAGAPGAGAGAAGAAGVTDVSGPHSPGYASRIPPDMQVTRSKMLSPGGSAPITRPVLPLLLFPLLELLLLPPPELVPPLAEGADGGPPLRLRATEPLVWVD